MIAEVVQTILLVLIGLFFFCTIVAYLLTWFYFASYSWLRSSNGYAPPVSIIKPVRGVDQLALDNFRSFCEQEYSNEYEILFCVEEQSDPVIPVIDRILEEYPDKHVRLIFSNSCDTGAIGKIKNMIAGFKQSSYGVIIFSDSDAHVPPTFIRDTVACMEDPDIGIGFSVPAYEGPEEWAAALTNISVNELVLRLVPLWFLRLFDGAIGTTMVVRRSVIEQIGGLDQFRDQITDDIPLARAIHRRGYRIHILKQPARVFHHRDSFARWWSHMHRWRVIILHYWPVSSWFVNLVELGLWWSLFYMAISLFQNQHISTSIYLVIAVLVVSLITAAVINIVFVHNTKLWRFLWIVPILELLRLPLLIHSCLKHEVVWRGRRFQIRRDCTMQLVDNLSGANDGP